MIELEDTGIITLSHGLMTNKTLRARGESMIILFKRGVVIPPTQKSALIIITTQTQQNPGETIDPYLGKVLYDG